MGDNKNQALFLVIFEDNTQFKGGEDYFNTLWLKIPKDKKIKRLFYRLPNNDYICLSNYDSFFHMIEATNDIMGSRKGIPTLRYAYIMGKKNDLVTSYRITLFQDKNDKYKTGDITKREMSITHEKIKGLNPNNWRG